MADSFISTEIDFSRDGKQVSHLRLPYSHNGSGWGTLPIPLAVIRNGDGPTVLLTAGNHGDEYEGQILLDNLLRSLQPQDIRGRVIIMPAMNYPAALAGTRLSPLDGLNMNRVFPGDAHGMPTQQIAHYVHGVLMPMADFAMDLHSGGGSMDFVPTVMMYRAKTRAVMDQVVAASRLFGCPLGVILDDMGETRTIDAVAREMGLVKLGTELAGAGSVSVPALRQAEAGLWRLLRHWGVLTGAPRLAPDRVRADPPPFRLMEITGPEAYVFATAACLFEPNFRLGDTVAAGGIAGWQHFLDEIARDPVPLHFRKDGVVFCRRHPGRTLPGDPVAVVVSDADAAA